MCGVCLPAHPLTMDPYRSYGGQVGPDDPVCRPDSLLLSVPVLFGGEDRLDDGNVEGDQQLLRQVKLPEL